MTRKYRSKFQQNTLVNFIKEAKSLCDRNLLTDVVLECEGELFPVHKLILAASSPYFQNYILQEHSLQDGTIKVDFTSPEVLRIILQYFYTGRIIIDKQQNPTLLKAILEASAKLQIPLLCNYCLALLLKKTESKISVTDWNVTEKLETKIVSDIFLQNILKKLGSLNKTQDFLQLTENQLNVLFQCPKTTECDQNIIFQSILNWIKFDENGRKEHLTKFLGFVDFIGTDPIILSVFQDEDLLKENDYFLRSYFELMSKQTERENKEFTKSSINKAKKAEILIQKTTQVKDCLKSFENIPNTAQKCYNTFTYPILEMKFFIYSCEDHQRLGKQIYIYDYAKDKLNRMIAHPLQTVSSAAIICYKNNIYAFGGLSFSKSKRTYSNCYTYNRATEKWLVIPELKNYRSGSEAVVLNQYIYIIGGYRFREIKSVKRYDPSADQWTTVADLPATEDDSSITKAIAVNDCLYVLLNTKLHKYIPEEDKWNLVNVELNTKFTSKEIHMSQGNDKIFLIEKEAPKSVWIFDPKDNSVTEDILPAVLTECDGIMNLDNPDNLEFLVSGNRNWFIYRPFLHSWNKIDSKQLYKFEFSMLTLLPSEIK